MTAREIVALIRRYPEWAVIVAAWFAAAMLPGSWFMAEDHWWRLFDFDDGTFHVGDSPLIYQPFVPLFVAALLYQDRAALSSALHQTSRSKRHGAPWLLWLGFLGLAIAHLVHVLTFATLSLLVIAAGIVYTAFGPNVLKKARRALLFGLLLVPPPATLVAVLDQKVGEAVSKIIILVIQKFGKASSLAGGLVNNAFDIGGHSVKINSTQVAGMSLAAFGVLFWCVWHRRPFWHALLLMTSGALLALIGSIVVPIVAFLLPISPLTDTLACTHPAVYAAVAGTIVLVFYSRLRSVSSAMAKGARTVGAISAQAQKATDRATANMAAGMSRRVGGKGKGLTKVTEAAMDRFFKTLGRPFKRKRRDW